MVKWDRNKNGQLSKGEISDKEVLDRFYRMDLNQDGELNQPEWDRQAEVFRRAQNLIMALEPKGRGDQSDRALVWKYHRGVPYVPTPLLYRGTVWMVKDGGIVTKLDALNGQVLREERLPGM